MDTCNVVTRGLEKLVGLRPVELPEGVRDHVAACPTCGRRLAAARLARGMVLATTEATAPPEGFADRVRTALAARKAGSRSEADIWRPAWGLMPAFAAAVAALFIVYQTSEVPAPSSLLSTESLSAGEYLVFGSPGPEMDDIVAVVLEGDGK